MPSHRKPGANERSSPEAVDALVDAVRALILCDLVDGNLNVQSCALQLEISRRQLQRLLSEAGWTYTRLVGQVRLEKAEQLLADETRKLADIASQLGYSKSDNFTRAFRRLSGMTPAEFRQNLTRR